MEFGLRSSSKGRLDKASSVSQCFSAKKNYSAPLFLLNHPDFSPIPCPSPHSAFIYPLRIRLRVSVEAPARLHPSSPPHRKRSWAGNSPGNDPFPQQDNTPTWWSGRAEPHKAFSGASASAPGGQSCSRVILVVSSTTLGVITNIIMLFFCSRWDMSTWQNQGLEICSSSIAVRKTTVRKPSPPAAGGALYSEIMREQHSRKETPCGPACQGSKLPPLGRHHQLKDELSLPRSRVRLREEKAGERWLEMCWLGWGRLSLEDVWHPQSWETGGQSCGDATS